MQARRNDEFLTIRNQSPDQLAFAEIGGDTDREHSPLPAGQEVSRLTSIGSAAIDPIVGADRDIQFLLRIAIEIAQKQAEGSIRVLEPAFEGPGDAGARFMHWLQG